MYVYRTVRSQQIIISSTYLHSPTCAPYGHWIVLCFLLVGTRLTAVVCLAFVLDFRRSLLCRIRNLVVVTHLQETRAIDKEGTTCHIYKGPLEYLQTLLFSTRRIIPDPAKLMAILDLKS